MNDARLVADYATVAAAIRYLADNALRQPTLAEVAAAVGLSEFHFQRLFGEFAGISPKRFLQFLTKEHAKSVLRSSANVFDAALEVGLSGPGRLHDLLVSCEAVTPGEMAADGEGLTLRWGIHPTRFGEALIAVSERGICHVGFVEPGAGAAAVAALAREWPRARLVVDPHAGAAVAEALSRLDGGTDGGRRKPLHLLLRGTNFQIQVWQALLRIPPGQLASYGDIARATGAPRAARAVGGAIGSNALAVLIPCHRVIRGSGEFGHYRWNDERKRLLIACEAARTTQSL